MSLKQIHQLKHKKVFRIEENNNVYTFRKDKITSLGLSLVCRKRKCKRGLELRPIHNFK